MRGVFQREAIDAARKRIFDVVMAAGLLALLSPIILLLAIAIKLESSGPVF